MKLSKLKLNKANPRFIKDDKFAKLLNSIREFPKMMELRPIVYDTDGTILGGNMRYRALLELGKSEIPDTWAVPADSLTDDEKQRFIIEDNVGFGEWDFEALHDWDSELLDNWGLDVPEWDAGISDDEVHAKLQDKFIVPPFSVLDTRQGYWQERKKVWRELIGDNGESRELALGNKKTFNKKDKFAAEGMGVSFLDPVLSEISNLWFGIPNGNTFDCFAGDSVFGFVSNYLGNTFTGIELRQEQTDLNNQRLTGTKSKYICDDGQNVLKHIKPESQDLLFSCPPYFDLEVYSKLENDASNQKEYSDFLKIIENAFTDSIKCLKENRFAVIVVGDIRDKKGFYRGFIDDIKNIFKGNGVQPYNELILIESIGSRAIVAEKTMVKRSVMKCHQNVLVFFKGDPKEIKNIYPKLNFPDETFDVE